MGYISVADESGKGLCSGATPEGNKSVYDEVWNCNSTSDIFIKQFENIHWV
jgi:hypothetical protein